MESVTELFRSFISDTTDNIYVMNPCKVVGVHGNYVDVLLYINDEELDFTIYNVPIIRQETQQAYIFLGIKEGDRGTCRFFDRSTEGYLQSDFDYNSDDRQHDINDRCFELGFIPDKEAYVYPTDKEIEIGLKKQGSEEVQKFTLSVNENGDLDIISTTKITLTAPNINTNGLLTHTGNVSVIGDVTVSNNITSTSGTIKGKINATNGLLTGTNLDLVNVSNGIVTREGSSGS